MSNDCEQGGRWVFGLTAGFGQRKIMVTLVRPWCFSSRMSLMPVCGLRGIRKTFEPTVVGAKAIAGGELR